MIWVYTTTSPTTTRGCFKDYLEYLGYQSTPHIDGYLYLYIYDCSQHNLYSEYSLGDKIFFIAASDVDNFSAKIQSDYKFIDTKPFLRWSLDSQLNNLKKGEVMFFKDLIVGDVFTLAPDYKYKFIKISKVNDNVEFRNHCEYPSNVLILDNEHYGTISPRAKVKIIKHYSGQESEDSVTPKYYQQNDKYDYKILLNHLSDWANYNILDIEKYILTKKVIFNDPATIVYWLDGTKTVVKCQGGEKFDKEKGLALCFLKKIMGNKGNYNNRMKKIIDNARSDKNE